MGFVTFVLVGKEPQMGSPFLLLQSYDIPSGAAKVFPYTVRGISLKP